MMSTNRYAALVAATCALAVSGGARATVFPGEDPGLAVIAGQGLNSITRSALGNCVKIGKFQQQSGNSTGQIAESWMEELVNSSQLTESLSIDASAYMSNVAGAVSNPPGGSLGYVSNVQKNSLNRYVLVRTRVGNQLQVGSDFKLAPGIQQYLTQGGSAAGFFSNCGNEFIYSTRTGVEIVTVIEFVIKTSSDLKKFSLIGQNLQYQQWVGNADIEYQLQKLQGFAKTHVYMIRRGGHGAIPYVDNLDDLIKQFPAIVDASQSDPVALEMVGKAYGGVEPMQLIPDDSQMREMDYVIKELAARHMDTTDGLRSIRYVRANPKDFKSDAQIDLKAEEQEFSGYLKDLETRGRACISGFWSQCKLPSDPVPLLNLPDRKK